MNRILLLAALILANCAHASKFEPLEGRILVLGGQNTRDTLDYYRLANTPRPAGFSDYISYNVGDPYTEPGEEAVRIRDGTEGLLHGVNWGAGEQCVACLLDRPEFVEAAINIGMYIAGPTLEDGTICTAQPECAAARLARGEFDEQLDVFGRWLKSQDSSPVFLRIGYEFDGEWNAHDPAQFKAAWKYIHRYFSRLGVTNVAYVFHSYGYATMETLNRYYPGPDEFGDSYVDWVGYSYFTIDPEKPGINEMRFAREKGLKVFLGEVAPHRGGDCENQIDIEADPELGKRWVENFFRHVEDNRDVIRAIAYINANWSDGEYSPMWIAQDDQNCRGFFYKSNSKLNGSPQVEQLWSEYISRDLYLNWRENLYRYLLR